MAKFLTRAAAKVIFFRLSESYFHSESFPCFLCRPLNQPRLGVWRNAIGGPGGRLSVKQEKKRPV